MLCTARLMLETRQGHPAKPVPVPAYDGSSKNLNYLEAGLIAFVANGTAPGLLSKGGMVSRLDAYS